MLHETFFDATLLGLKFKAQLTFRFFAAVNHNYGVSQGTLKHRNKQNGSKSTNHDRKT